MSKVRCAYCDDTGQIDTSGFGDYSPCDCVEAASIPSQSNSAPGIEELVDPQTVLHHGERWAADLINGLRRDIRALQAERDEMERKVLSSEQAANRAHRRALSELSRADAATARLEAAERALADVVWPVLRHIVTLDLAFEDKQRIEGVIDGIRHIVSARAIVEPKP